MSQRYIAFEEQMNKTKRINRQMVRIRKKILDNWYLRCDPLLFSFSVKITNAQKRWGSCGPRGTLNFSWRLIMMPVEVIDYLIVHELVHIGQPDHSRLFWTKVRCILPDYKEREKCLKQNDRLLTL